MIARAAIVAALLAGAGVVVSRSAPVEARVAREPLAVLPLHIGPWTGHDAAPLADDVVGQLGVDDYINRRYVKAGTVPVGLYVGYYESQRQGDAIHSPQNCLPGAGWHPVSSERTTIAAQGEGIPVNRYVIQKGLDRQVVLYWYQGRGRVVANEYMNKLLLMVDAARLRRTDGALVRLIAPVVTTAETATADVSGFAAVLLPRLAVHLP